VPDSPHPPITLRKTALLLIAHGSRHGEANADLHHVVTVARGWGRYSVVEGCFLELAEPDIEEGGARCVAQGAERVVMLPYFLSAGVHVRRDLAESRRRLAERFPRVDFRLGEPLGRHPLLLDVVAERARQAEE
jgi:sirohydrochlorin ferrochelatase